MSADVCNKSHYITATNISHHRYSCIKAFFEKHDNIQMVEGKLPPHCGAQIIGVAVLPSISHFTGRHVQDDK
eukprot:6853666-Ditylum_brightwellii.AAC.1